MSGESAVEEASDRHHGYLNHLAEEYHAMVPGDNPFQRRARVLQSLWRAEQGYEAGTHRGRLLGSRLPMPWAEESLANYLTDTIRAVVPREVTPQARGLYGYPRIYDNLLSSQPLCFNLFAELQQDLPLATAVLQDLMGDGAQDVTAVRFEYSPGRGDPRYTSDNSAFDVYFEFTGPVRTRGFIGVEVKYHESLQDEEAKHRPRYDAVAAEMECFDEHKLAALQERPLQQLWRNHLLAGSLQQADGFDEGIFAFLYPEGNLCCANAAENYRDCLARQNSFAAWTLEGVAEVLKSHTGSAWVDVFVDRYLDFGKLSPAGRA
jgi:hypothetical protein